MASCSALRLLGECASRAADRESAPDYFERAIGVLRDIGAQNELAHAHAGYGRLHRDLRDTKQGSRHLRRALEIYERLGTLGEADQVRQELAGLSPAG